MPASDAPARRHKFTRTCDTCGAKIAANETRAAGWRARSPTVWYCSDHIPDDLPERPVSSGRPRRRWPSRTMKVCVGDHINPNSHRLVFAFGLADIAAAAGRSEQRVRNAIWDGVIDPMDLSSITAWITAAQRASEPPYDRLLGRSRWRSGEREVVADDLRALGLAVGPAPDAIEIHGDLLTPQAARRVLAYVRKHGPDVERATLRQVALGLQVHPRARATPPPVRPVVRPVAIQKLVGELRVALEIDQVHAASATAISISGIPMDLCKAREILTLLKRGPAAARDQLREALVTLAGHRRRSAAASRRKRAELKLRRVSIPRATAADSP